MEDGKFGAVVMKLYFDVFLCINVFIYLFIWLLLLFCFPYQEIKKVKVI